ncbi:MAG: peptidoglycan-binding protein [Acidimicrobiales bacterium]
MTALIANAAGIAGVARRGRARDVATNVYGQLLQLQRDAGNQAVTGLVGAERPMLRRGARGEQVRRLQEALNTAGAVKPALDADGKFGAQTKRGVRRFQRREGLGVDGIVGPDTWSALAPHLAGGATDQSARDSATEAGEVHQEDVTEEKADEHEAKARATAAARLPEAFATATELHAAGSYAKALVAYGEASALAIDSGKPKRQRVCVERMREARLQHDPSSVADIERRLAAEDAAGPTADTPERASARARASEHFRAGNPRQALAMFEELYRSPAEAASQEESETVWMIASCHHHLGSYPVAVSWYEQAVTLFEEYADGGVRAVIMARLREASVGRPPTPSADLKREYLAKRHPGSDEGDGGPTSADEKEAELVARLRPIADAAVEAYHAGDHRGALELQLKVYSDAGVAFHGGMGSVMFNIGLCYHHLRRWDEAISFYLQARESRRELWSGFAVFRIEDRDFRESCLERVGRARRREAP